MVLELGTVTELSRLKGFFMNHISYCGFHLFLCELKK